MKQLIQNIKDTVLHKIKKQVDVFMKGGLYLLRTFDNRKDSFDFLISKGFKHKNK